MVWHAPAAHAACGQASVSGRPSISWQPCNRPCSFEQFFSATKPQQAHRRAHIGAFRQSHASGLRRRATREPASLCRASAAVRASADAPHAGKRVLILGGTGRVGSLTAAELLRSEPGLDIVLAGRREASYRKVVEARPELAAARFMRCDIDSDADLAAALKGVDLVVHTAGCAACWSSQVLLAGQLESLGQCLASVFSACSSALPLQGGAAAVERWLLVHSICFALPLCKPFEAVFARRRAYNCLHWTVLRCSASRSEFKQTVSAQDEHWILESACPARMACTQHYHGQFAVVARERSA